MVNFMTTGGELGTAWARLNGQDDVGANLLAGPLNLFHIKINLFDTVL